MRTFKGSIEETYTDHLATEEPLEIRIRSYNKGELKTHSVSVTMRTPGHDFELATGFLLSEGIIRKKSDIDNISYCTDPNEPQMYNIVNIDLSRGLEFNTEKFTRNVYTNSSCGICGRASIDLVRLACDIRPMGNFKVTLAILDSIYQQLTQPQTIFARTGGVHASGLFDQNGCLLVLREDVGRHNAFDKLTGTLLLKDSLPAFNTIVLVSGRASFELIQKSVLAGIPVFVSVGAPSNLAVGLAREYGVTLIGFFRQQRFNVYSGEERLA